jgi:hypothetical protein
VLSVRLSSLPMCRPLHGCQRVFHGLPNQEVELLVKKAAEPSRGCLMDLEKLANAV